ncbi:TSN3-like protein [Mya arenaria]|uniref:Tetraspanin n=1 Tax=Mya arenaria TaxID=6604 RepID=A0ABY7DTB1_MYAAR|nr:tetraspanin-3-like [Mya arenaria]WAR00952.1 TSN3-like protein [Mya arenaria]
MASCSGTFSKIALSVIGFLFWGAAAGLIFLGAWVFKTYKHYNELTTANLTLIPALIVIIVGVILFFLGCMGCCAAFKENKCLLAVFFSLMLVILTALVMAGVLGYVFRNNLESSVKDGLTQALNKYPKLENETNTEKDQIDYLQKKMKCCGISNYTDWKNTTRVTVPQSCCINGTKCDVLKTSNLYKQGCLKQLEDEFVKNLKYVAGVAITFAVIMLLGMMCSCVLLCKRKEVRYELLGGPNSGLRV